MFGGGNSNNCINSRRRWNIDKCTVAFFQLRACLRCGSVIVFIDITCICFVTNIVEVVYIHHDVGRIAATSIFFVTTSFYSWMIGVSDRRSRWARVSFVFIDITCICFVTNIVEVVYIHHDVGRIAATSIFFVTTSFYSWMIGVSDRRSRWARVLFGEIKLSGQCSRLFAFSGI